MCISHTTQTDRDLAATGVKNNRAFQDFSAYRCLPRGRTRGENVKYDENLSKTCLKYLLNPSLCWLQVSKQTINMKKDTGGSKFSSKLKVKNYHSMYFINVHTHLKTPCADASKLHHFLKKIYVAVLKSTWSLVSPQPEKAPFVGGGLSIVIEERQTPACCVGDSLKECQRKHSQTTCSPRAAGLASLQAHLHTIPQLFRKPAKETKRGQRRERRVPRQRENLLAMWQRCQWWKRWHLRETMKGSERITRIYSLYAKFSPCARRLTAIFATVHLYHSTGFTCQSLLG